MTERLTLKWGTLKGWDLEKDSSQDILRRYVNLGYSPSALFQRDTPEQKQLLCDLIDAVDGEIWADWDGKVMTPAEAKEYVTTYGKQS